LAPMSIWCCRPYTMELPTPYFSCSLFTNDIFSHVCSTRAGGNAQGKGWQHAVTTIPYSTVLGTSLN
jgi:hypothetical protein